MVVMAAGILPGIAASSSAASLPSSSSGCASLRNDVAAEGPVGGAHCSARDSAPAARSLSWAHAECSSGGRRVVPRGAVEARLLWGRRRRRSGRNPRGGRVVVAALRGAEELVRSGVVRPVEPKNARQLLNSDEYLLLDVRPIWEREKAYVSGSYHVPLFVEDVGSGPMTFLKKGILSGQGGWWLGLKLTARNENFVDEVKANVPGDQKLLVACGEGLRSLLAAEELHENGFEQMAWLAGGFNKARLEDFVQVEGPTELRFAAVGGAAEYVLKFAILIQGLMNLMKRRQKSVDGT